MKRSLSTLARGALALAFLSTAVNVTNPSAAGAAAPAIVVTPTANLVDGTPISVSVTNPLPNTSVAVQQCYGTDSPDQCWTYTTGIQHSTSLPLTIHASRWRFWGSPLGPLVDCGVVQCMLRIEATQPFQAAYLVRNVALQFVTDTATIRQPIAVASQTTALVDNQVVRIAGLGFSPGAEFRIRQCWVPYTYPWLERCQGNTVVNSDANGLVASNFTVRRRFTAIEPAVTCGDGNTPCFVIVQRTDALGERALVMISFVDRPFAPAPLVPLAVTVPEDVGTALVPVILGAEPDRLVNTIGFNWRTLPWTAGPSDFSAVPNRVTLVSPYLSVVYLPVRIVNDTIDEGNEIVFTHIPSAVNATVGGYSGVGVVIIVDDD